MVSLLDTNVLIALAWPNHVHHGLALSWFGENQDDGWATCPGTQSGFVRISSNRHVLPEAKSPSEALLLLERIVDLPHHRFWKDEIAIVDSEHVGRSRIVGHRQVSDAHLLAVALSHGGRLATLDNSIYELVPAGIDRSRAICLLSQPN